MFFCEDNFTKEYSYRKNDATDTAVTVRAKQTLDAFAWPKLLLILVATGDTDGFETFATDDFEGFAAALALGRRGSVLLMDDSLSAWADFVCLTRPPLLWHIFGQREHLMMIPWLKLADGLHFPARICLVSALEVV